MSKQKPQLKIQFGKSSSESYQVAVNRMKKFNNSTLIANGDSFNSINFEGSEILKNHRKIQNLWSLVGNWKSSFLTFNDESIKIYELERIKLIFDCNDKYHLAADQDNYCYDRWMDGKWGCKYLSQIKLGVPINPYSSGGSRYWYRYGKFGRT